MAHPYWPLFDLAVRTPRITLVYVDDELAVELTSLAAKGIHDSSTMPFSVPWTDVESPELERNTLQYYWRSRAETTVEHWSIDLAVIADGTIIGVGTFTADQYPTLRSVETGSWLGKSHQGRGFGKELRAASLHLIFDGLRADFATSGAWADNAASIGVTRSLGYTETGRRRAVRRDQRDVLIGYEMSRQHWKSLRRDDIELIGVEPVRRLLGITSDLA